MKKVLQLLPFIIFSAFALKCDRDSQEVISYRYTINVNFEYGANLSPTEYKNIYVIWIEGMASGTVQNINVCQKLITGGLTGIVLPYWKMNKYPASSVNEVDAVTSATKSNSNFSVSAILKDNTVRKFVLYFEIDRAYEPNDWFSDQPALLYSVNINLDESLPVYELLPVGWTPNEETQNIIQNTPMGKLQNEMRYITNLKTGSSFGAVDPHSATKMVKKITATIDRSAVARTFENGRKL
jgi:hypothetical protein